MLGEERLKILLNGYIRNFEADYNYVIDAISPNNEGMTLGMLPPPGGGVIPNKIQINLIRTQDLLVSKRAVDLSKLNRFNQFEWNIKIKPESSFRDGLEVGSNIPRFDARIEYTLSGDKYINPFTGQIGGPCIGKHIPL
jgi:hypothetical protein